MWETVVIPSGQVNQINHGTLGHFFSGGIFALLDEGDSDDGVSPGWGGVHVSAGHCPVHRTLVHAGAYVHEAADHHLLQAVG